MKAGIMQPYFIPYLGYFSLIKNVELFILFDTPQFINHGWIERNRILKPNSGWQYISIPLVKHSRDTRIQDIKINNNIDWRKKIFNQLEHYKKRAPFYNETIKILEKAFDIDTDSITELNKHSLKVICDYIGIELNIEVFSEMNLKIEEVKARDEWALNICKALGDIEEYWNSEGGVDFFDKNKYEKTGIKIKFLKINLPRYKQRRDDFEYGLSIVDAMMFNTPNEINKMLDNYKLI